MPAQAAATPAITRRISPKHRDRAFYTGMALLIAIIVFAGFARTYFLRSMYGHPPLKPLLHVHGFLFSSWIVLLIVQTALVAGRRVQIHRQLGVAGGVLASSMIVVGMMAAIDGARRGLTIPGGPPPLVFLTIPFFDIVMFAVFIGAALVYRRKPEMHKRLMLLGTLAILAAAIARLPFAFIHTYGPLAFYGLIDVLLLLCILYDVLSRRRVHPAYIWGGLALVISQPLRLALGGTGAWLAFARWITG